ncbi:MULTISPECIES: hypothetical protein [unclassified Microcoleus]|uniref:hypothetical protein n=1 Tax=unclassified Microcoleus TaxID=2642155 RepID=UPI002FD71780
MVRSGLRSIFTVFCSIWNGIYKRRKKEEGRRKKEEGRGVHRCEIVDVDLGIFYDAP